MGIVSAVQTAERQREDGLVELCAQGSEVAWRRFYLEYGCVTRRFLFRLGVDAESLDDACQDVFIEAFRYLPDYRGEASMTTWLYRLCITQARRTRYKRRLRRALAVLLWRADEPTTAGELAPEQASALLRDGLAELTEQERAVFVLYELEGQSGAEIADVLACPEATVFRRLHYARKKFRAFVADRRVS
jgi:RNA polymerase sigma-70 factor (ECF subfamily)